MDNDVDAAELRGQGPAVEPHLGHQHFHRHHTHHQPYEHDPQLPGRSDHLPVQSPDLDDDAATTSPHHHAFNAVSPDDFYKSYRALQYDSMPDSLPMASPSVSRPSLRSNGDGTTPKHPVVSANRTLPRPTNVRAASNPVDARLSPAASKNAPSSKPSVKDLKKRFDQSSSPSSIPRVPSQPGSAARAGRDFSSPSSKSREGTPSYSTLRSGASDIGNTSKLSRSQRPKFVAEDQVSNNAQSFASRVGKPRSSLGANAKASRSMTQLTPDASPQPPPTSSPTTLPSQGLLFGEILPEQSDDTSALGFGIDSLRPRGLSESEPHSSWNHRRSLSDPDVEPSSPSTWYRNVNTQDSNSHPQSPVAARGHTRSHSDVATQNPSPPITRKGATRNPPTSYNQASASSRLPLSVRNLSSTTGSSSPESTRSNSPSTLKQPRVNGRASRATTPTHTRPPTRKTRTSTEAARGRKGRPEALPTPNSNTRLQAYIATPPPKLSPPLRSSRPRQPVSMATTASSRMRAAEKPKLNPTVLSRAPSRTPDPEIRRRKISVGPIDFEQRREHIRLAYTKSVRESQALEARKKAAERRRQELEAATKAKAGARAASITSSTPPPEQVSGDPGSPMPSPTVQHDPEYQLPLDAFAVPSSPTEPSVESQPTISPEIPTTSELPVQLQITSSPDSPTLGVPGSFPPFTPPMNSDEPPLSAVSVATETTEFDNETQTHSPMLPPESPQEIQIPITIAEPPSPRVPTPDYERAEHHEIAEQEPGPSNNPPVIQDDVQSCRDSISTDCDGYSVMPGAFGDDYDTESPFTVQTPFEATANALPHPNDDILRADQNETVAFPRIEMQYESDCQSDLDDSQEPMNDAHYTNDDATTDACTEDTDEQGRTEECHSESQFDDELSAYRASSCASSDEGDGGHVEYPTYDYQAMESNELLLAPPSRPDRISQHSQWTDLTVDSPNPSDLTKTPDMDEQESPTFGHVTIFQSSVLPRNSDTIPREPEQESPRVRPSYSSTRTSEHAERPCLPDVDSGKEFTIPYLGQSSSYVPSPDHEPPPIPTPASGSILDSRRTSSGFYDPSQYGSIVMESARGSEDFMSQMETPQTIGTSSLGTSEQYFGGPSIGGSDAKVLPPDGQELTDKERRRLAQRRNVLKELLDTEAVFVRDMNIVEEIYKGTAEACPKLDSKTIKQIFRNTDEIIAFHTSFLAQVKEAVSGVYTPKTGREDGTEKSSKTEISDAKDREVSLGPVFKVNIESMKIAHEGFLRSSDQAAKGLIQIQQDPTVKVWLNECNEVAKELTAAWDLDSLLIKPMQRITKYPNLIITLLQHTPQDHPDREALMSAKETIETAIIDINKTKKNFELVGQIVGRKRKESDGKGGFARAFGKRVDKLQATGNRPPEDAEYAKFEERFGDDYLRLQVVLRDVEFYTRQVSSYVREFLQYLSSIELVMRLQPGNYPEIESKWVQFNISIRDLEKIALEEHLAQVRKQVIEPFELVIRSYGNPSLAMKKRQKRRLDYERMEQLKRVGKNGDSRLQENVEQYEALNDTLKKELPKLSALTEKVGNICLGNFVAIQTKWFGIWKDKMKTVLVDYPDLPDLDEVVSTFQHDFPYVDEQMAAIGIVSLASRGRPSIASNDDALSKKTRSPRPSDVDTLRSRGLSTNGDGAPSLPTPDFLRRNSGSLSMSPTGSKPSISSPHQYYYRDYYAGIGPQANNSSSGMTPEIGGSSRSLAASTRPSTGRSFDSGGMPRQSTDSTSQYRRDSSTTYNSNMATQEGRRFSGLFHSALPLPDGPEESRRSSRASSRERGPANDGYNVLWLAASLFEFNIETTKHEAGYPYLIYQAGEIFDVIAEKGELWLAKNQDDPNEQVGWIWSKHFAKLADS